MISLSVHRLLYDGIRGMKDQDLLLKGLGYLDRGVVLAEIPPFPYEPKGRSTEELEILDLAQRRVTVRRLGWAEGGLTFPRLRAVYALLAAGILREADSASAPQPVVQTETGMFLLSALHNRPDPSLREAIRREVQQELQHSARLDRDAWLKLARAAPRDELVRALEEKMERYHALREGVSEDDSLRTDIDVILGRASSALRLARQAPETASADAVLARHAVEAEAALRQAVPPPVAAPPPGPAAEEPEPEETAVRLASPADRPLDQTQPPVREVLPPDETHPPTGRPDESMRTAAPGASGFEGQAQIEHLLMEGEVRMTVADYANAVKVYEKLVRTAPRVAAFHLRLAVAMACYPRAQKLAEREFYEAARLEPENAEIHYQWGLYYKVMKIKSRAVAEMRTAVRLSPKHKAARAELESLSPKDSALTSFKKLFR
jgi:tetratricopeptide (TPR) repeat protein